MQKEIIITEKQSEVLNFIRKNLRPTNKEIAKFFNLKGCSSVQRRTEPLTKKGLIKNTGSGYIYLGDNLNFIKVKKTILCSLE